MYQINLRAQAGKLAALTTHWPFTRVQQRAVVVPRQHGSRLRMALAELANLASLRAMLGSTVDTTERHDPRDPCNW
jgi:hypothetical protein